MTTQICLPLKHVAGTFALLALVASGSAPATAQETTTTTTTEQTSTDVATASPEEICEALQRAQERTRKWLEEGVPEMFGSEEPFTFDPTKC